MPMKTHPLTTEKRKTDQSVQKVRFDLSELDVLGKNQRVLTKVVIKGKATASFSMFGERMAVILADDHDCEGQRNEEETLIVRV